MRGGCLNALGERLGLVSAASGRSVRLGLVIAGVLWGVMAILAVAGGVTDRIFALSVIAGHVRVLVTIPLFFLCEVLAQPASRPLH